MAFDFTEDTKNYGVLVGSVEGVNQVMLNSDESFSVREYWNRMKGALMKEQIKVIELKHLNDIFLDAEIETIVTTTCPHILHDMLKNPRFLPPDVKHFMGLKSSDAN